MNIDNLNKLIAHIQALPSARVNMQNFSTGELADHDCGTCGCIAGWALFIRDGRYDVTKYDGSTSFDAAEFIGITDYGFHDIFYPQGYEARERYPAHRVIATLKRLRDTYLSTGQVVVDWGPEPGEKPKQAWTAPQVAEVINPALPAELTSLLRNTVEA